MWQSLWGRSGGTNEEGVVLLKMEINHRNAAIHGLMKVDSGPAGSSFPLPNFSLRPFNDSKERKAWMSYLYLGATGGEDFSRR